MRVEDIMTDLRNKLDELRPYVNPNAPDFSRVFYTVNATKNTKERLFKKSKHRSTRTHKKLLKRYGSEFRREPAIYQQGSQLIAHPAFRRDIEYQLNN